MNFESVNPPEDKNHPLEEIAKAEEDTPIGERNQSTRKKQPKYYNKMRLHNYWEEHPILRFIPTTLRYLGGKLIRKL